MMDSQWAANCYAIPSPEGHTFHSDDHQARVGGDGPNETSELIPDAPRAKWTYFLLGCAILLPFNALFNSTPFFLSRLAGTPLYSTFSSYSSSVYTLTKLVCQFYCTVTSKQSSRSRRIFASIIGMVLLVTCLCLSTFIQGTPSTFFAFSLFTAASMAVAASYLCTAVYAGAALLGASFLQAVLAGQAAIAVVVSVVQVASSVIALWGSSLTSVLEEASEAGGRDGHAEDIAARIFFGVSAMFLCITLVSYAWTVGEPAYKSLTNVLEQHGGAEVADERTGLLADDGRNSSPRSKSGVYQVFRRNLIFMFSIAYVFIVTLAIYPAVTVRVRPVSRSVHPLLFTAVHFLVINIGGFVGQYSCSIPRLQVWSGKKILAMSLLRTLFIPLMLLCNIDRPVPTTLIPPIIQSDVLFMTIVLIMGYTTGYVSTQTLLAASSLEHNPRLKGRHEDVDIVATLCGSCMIFGLALGSLSSFVVLAAMRL